MSRGQGKDKGVSKDLERVRSQTGKGGGSNPPQPNSAQQTPNSGENRHGPVGEDVPSVEEVGVSGTQVQDDVNLAYDQETQDMPEEFDPGPEPASNQGSDADLAFEGEAETIDEGEDLTTLIPNQQGQQSQGGRAPQGGQRQQTVNQGGQPSPDAGPNGQAPETLPDEYQPENQGQQRGQGGNQSGIITPEQDQSGGRSQGQRDQQPQQNTQSSQTTREQSSQQQTKTQNPNMDPPEQVTTLCEDFLEQVRNMRLSVNERKSLSEKLDKMKDEADGESMEKIVGVVIDELDL